MNTKEELCNLCVEFITKRFETIKSTIDEIQESLTSETKSSAGDKHETGRTMLQLEREKAGNQLAEIQKTKEILSKIDIFKSPKIIGLGSVVYTSKYNYFIAISAGKLIIDNEIFYAISSYTPVGQLLIGKIVNNNINFRNEEFKIKIVL